MAVTNLAPTKNFFARNQRPILLLPFIAVLMLAYQNCTVDLLETTPGASLAGGGAGGCTPEPDALLAFETILNSHLQATGPLPGSSKQACGSCHGQSALNSAKNVYTVFEGDTVVNPDIIKTNYCVAQGKGTNIADHPQRPTHGGTQYAPADVQPIIDFVTTYF